MQLSAVPQERRLQRSALVALGVFVLLLLATLVVLGASFAAVGAAPELQPRRDAWVDDHGFGLLQTLGQVLMPLATLVLPLAALRDRAAVGRIDGLKRQYLLATVLCGALGLWWGRWLGLAALVVGVALVAGIPRQPASGRRERIEGGTFGS